MITVKHIHCRELGYCNRGLRQWFSREGMDWPDFVKNGLSAEVLRSKKNAMADRVIAHAERGERGQQ